MPSVKEADGVLLTGDMDTGAAAGDLTVSMHPQRERGLNGEGLCFIGSDSSEAVMFALKGSGQCKENKQS